jgi:hypothetical protein
MQEVKLPSTNEIAAMSIELLRQERIRLLNEISFAQGEESIGGRPDLEMIDACKGAIAQITARLRELSDCDCQSAS